MTEIVEYPFRTPQDALMFAFNYSLQQQGRPLADRMASPGGRGGKGLSGMDGAGQAGMIRQEIKKLDRYEQAALTARFAPPSLPCSCRRLCCSGNQTNEEWADAIGTLTEGAISALAGHISHYRLRREIILQIFGAKLVIKDLAERCGVHANTASEHRRLIRVWMCGEKAHHEKGAREASTAVDGVESRARKKIDSLLSVHGFVGVPE